MQDRIVSSRATCSGQKMRLRDHAVDIAGALTSGALMEMVADAPARLISTETKP